MREELQVVGLRLDREQAIADAHFTAFAVQQQGRGLDAGDFAAGHGACGLGHELIAHELGVLAGEHPVAPHRTGFAHVPAAGVEVLGLEQVAAIARAVDVAIALLRAHHQVALARGDAFQPAHVGDLAMAAAQAVFLEADHVGQVVDAGDDAQVLEEGLDLGQRHRVDRAIGARTGLHADAVEVGQADHVARIDQVRVLDLRVGLPDLRPQPRLAQERAGDVPQRVATLDHIAVRMAAAQFGGNRISGHRQQCSGKHRAQHVGARGPRARQLRNTFKHGGHLPAPLGKKPPEAGPL